VSFNAKINELQRCNASLSSELSKWQYQAGLELNMRRQAEETADQLARDNEMLEKHIQEWKLMAERFHVKVARYCQGIDTIFTILEEVKSQTQAD
jgi:hypothetical protein